MQKPASSAYPASPAEPNHSDRPHSPAEPSAGALVQRLAQPDGPPFALLHRHTPGSDTGVVDVLTGPVQHAARLADIPDGPLGALTLVPFRQIAERGFEAHDDGTPLAVLVPEQRSELRLDKLLCALPTHRVPVESGGFDLDDSAYEEIVRRVVQDEIHEGEGANFVLRRTFGANIPGFSRADALALFGRLLRGEDGAYWTFLVHTGERVLLGASPEAHVRMSGGTVVMNPISGTYRYPKEGPDAEGLLRFLRDRKETEELSMVVDEELKMMCTVGDQGGVVVGPRLKEMAHLAHTEYELRGRSTLDVREVLRETLFAATVTGSPVQNACRVIARHEPTDGDGAGRGYYAGALALTGRDAHGAQTLDSPILIRTADIAADTGRLRLPVGATVVRDSEPASEAAETHAKAAGVLAALGVRETAPRARRTAPRLAEDPRVRAALEARRADLAPFWLRMRPVAPPGDRCDGTVAAGPEVSGNEPRGVPEAARNGILVVDGEDTFTSMLAHVLRSTGHRVTVRRHDEPGLPEAALGHSGPVVLGPGPGDPRDGADPKMRRLRSLAAGLVGQHHRALLGVCLGHELLAAELGLDLVRKERPYQGAQERIDLFGRAETVGFYNSFTARCSQEVVGELGLHGIEVSRDAQDGDVHALRGPGFAGVQFHPESLLTLNGAEIVAELLHGVLSAAGSVSP